MAAPKKPDHERRRHRIELRLNDGELDTLDEYADRFHDGNRRAAIVNAVVTVLNRIGGRS